MIDIFCDTEAKLPFEHLTPFQGELKSKTAEDIEALAKSIKMHGLCSPFFIWQDDQAYIIDGHSRQSAIHLLSLSDNSILEQEMPVVFITAESYEQAKLKLLILNQKYGKITKAGVKHFIQGTSIDTSTLRVLKVVKPKPVELQVKPVELKTVIKNETETETDKDVVKVIVTLKREYANDFVAAIKVQPYIIGVNSECQ